MAIRAGRVTRDVLLDAVLPTATKTYTVISHGFVINTAKQMLHDKGFNVVDEKYTALDGAHVACGAFHINYGDDPELGMLFAFANSYDKSLKFSCAIGAYVKTNNTSILSKDGSGWVRMHTGKADQEAADVIETLVDNAEAYFQQLQADKEAMKQIKLTRREYGELLGRLFLDLKILGMEQLSSIKKEFEKPSYKYTSDPDSLWALYNHILIGISKANPKTWMEQQKIIHFHLMDEFELTVFDEEESETPEVPPVFAIDLDEPIDLTKVPADMIVYPPLTNLDGSEPVNDLDAEEDADAEAVLTEIPQRAPVPTEEIPMQQPEPTAEEREPVFECLDCGHVREECICEAKDQALAEKAAEVKPKPTISMKDAVEKYADIITKEEGEAMLTGKGSEELLNRVKAAYLADQAKAEAMVDEIINDGGIKGSTAAELVGPTVDLDAEEDADMDRVMTPITHKPIDNNMPTTHNAIGSGITASAEEQPVEEPFTIEQFAELNREINAGAILPPMPGKTPEAEIETPEVEDVVEGVSEESEVDADEEFFMTKQDLDEMNEGVVLEVGFVVTIGEDDCEIVAITDDAYGLVTLTEPIDQVVEEQIAEEVEPEIEPVEEPVSMDFEIGDVEENAPAETMLRTEPVDEEQAKIDEALEVMNSKVELTPEELVVKAAIAMELEELYGVAPEFTYKLSNGEYTVTLDTAEVVVLTEDYIKSLEV